MPTLNKVYIPRKLYNKLKGEKSQDGAIARGLELYFKVKEAKREPKINVLKKIGRFFGR